MLLLLFLLFDTAATLLLSTAAPTPSPHLLNCSTTFDCGPLRNISYPFTGGVRPSDCGPPEFHLACLGDDHAELTTDSINYRVLELDQINHTLLLSRSDLYNNTCLSNDYFNTTLNSTIFSYGIGADNEDLTLLYGCSTLTNIQPGNLFHCQINGTSSISYYLLGPFPSDPILSVSKCNVSVRVPILKSYASLLTTNRSTLMLKVALAEGFSVNYTNPYEEECRKCQWMGGECGFDSSSASPICMCGGLVCSVTVSRRIGHLAGVVVGAVGVAVVIILVVFFTGKSLLNIKVCGYVNGENHADVEAFIAVHGSLAPKRYRYWEVKKMTNSFSEKLGKGGYGVVYKGQLDEDGRNVAVKVLTESKGNMEDFLNEVASISRTSHVNVITLLGFCYEGKKRALIYEFMFNGSLDKFIRNREASDASGPLLEWNILYRIAIGIARGLEYLHQGCSTRILHFDIKPQNILLDENFFPKISDFGLAKLCKQRESIVSMLEMRGTVGYIAPEVFSRNFGRVSHKSDVYSYGMLVLDMVGGRNKSSAQVSHTSESYFPDSIFKHIEEVEGIRALGTTSEEEEEAVRKMVLVGLWCIQTRPSCRPSMKNVIEMLEGSSHDLEVPPKPYLSSPVGSPKNSSFTSSDFISSSLNVEISPILQES